MDALVAFEGILGMDKVTLFQQRFAEGYAKYKDELYNIWNELKRHACEEVITSSD